MQDFRPATLLKGDSTHALSCEYCEIFKNTYNQFRNILRHFNVLPIFFFTTSETMGDYYLQTWYIRAASRDAERLKTEKHQESV